MFFAAALLLAQASPAALETADRMGDLIDAQATAAALAAASDPNVMSADTAEEFGWTEEVGAIEALPFADRAAAYRKFYCTKASDLKAEVASLTDQMKASGGKSAERAAMHDFEGVRDYAQIMGEQIGASQIASVKAGYALAHCEIAMDR